MLREAESDLDMNLGNLFYVVLSHSSQFMRHNILYWVFSQNDYLSKANTSIRGKFLWKFWLVAKLDNTRLFRTKIDFPWNGNQSFGL